MKSRPKVLAIILAGGKGGRLGPLTADRAKPAMPFGGTHRLIDFALSNCLHSGLADVWVVEQYELHTLNDHLANGRPWDLDRTHGGLQVLPPSVEGGGGEEKGEGGFAQGNADALWRQRELLRQFAPDLLLVLSADHLYRMDFRDLLDAHAVYGNPALTLVSTRVPPGEDPRRFSLLRVEEGSGRVTDFAYKPADPAGRELLAAEVFLFDAPSLVTTLEELATGEAPLQDYGHALLPRLVERGGVFAHPLEGYWRDVGTLESFWRAHRDLLSDPPVLRVDDPAWPILTAGQQRQPARVYASARVDNSLLSPGCEVRGRVERSVLGPGVRVAEGATVRDSIVFHEAHIEAGAEVRHAIVDEKARLGAGARVGAPPRLTVVPRAECVAPGARVLPEEDAPAIS
ncbi:MAG TPA: glucose-1-phosphate adenylyltransferase family protein [Chthoniobacterales bacterium]